MNSLQGCKQVQNLKVGRSGVNEKEQYQAIDAPGLDENLKYANRSSNICGRCTNGFHGSPPWWPFCNWKTGKNFDSSGYICTDLLDASFHNELIQSLSLSCKCFSIVPQDYCSLIDCSYRKRGRIIFNSKEKGQTCDICTVYKDTGFVRLSASSGGNLIDRRVL